MHERTPEPLSVLMVIENYLPWIGGAERQLAALAGALTARKIHVEVVTEQRHRSWPLVEKIAGVYVHRLPYPKVRWLGSCVLLLRAALFLCTQGRRFHLFHVHTANALAVLTVLVGRLLGKSVVVKAVGGWELERGVLNPSRRARLDGRVMLAILCRATVWIAISTHLRRAMEAAGIPPARIVLIPNGVDTVRFAPADQPHFRTPASRRGHHVVFVGRLVKEKALAVLLRAWVTVVHQAPDAELSIVGRGPLERELKALAAQLDLTKSVHFHGHHDNVVPFLRAANLFVLPSYVEGLSNTLLEAMAVGLPVVATRISGSEDIVEHGKTGLLAPPNDAEALAEALILMLRNPEQAVAMGQQARQRVVQACSLEQVATAYVRLYEQLVKDHGVRVCAVSQAS